MIVRDHTGVFAEVKDFIYRFTDDYNMKRLSEIELKVTYGRSYYSGVCKYPPKGTRNKPYRIICRVSKYNIAYNRFPMTVTENVGTETYDVDSGPIQLYEYIEHSEEHKAYRRVAVTGWKYISEEVTFCDQSEVLVFIFGHELWHFLCKTKQERGNWETKANKFGIEVLKAFRRWRVEQDAYRMAKG